MNIDLNKRWAQFDTEALVEAAINGNGVSDLIQEAKELMEATIASRRFSGATGRTERL